MIRPPRLRRHSAITRLIRVETLEPRQLLAAAPLGATWKDTGEFLLGKVAVTTVLFESNGQVDSESQNWSSSEIDQAIAKVENGVGWWDDVLDGLNTVHELEFVFDHTFAEQPFATSYEPIDRQSGDHTLYVGEFLAAQGYVNELNLEDAMWRFNHDQRERYGADWSFTVFVVDGSNGDGLFAPGGFPAAFALPGGLYMVVPSGREASTIAHEMGHIFWAFDEYDGGASYQAHRGYYDSQNTNAFEDNPNPASQEDSIMRGGVPLFNSFIDKSSAAATLALVGWRDSDGDGVFDVLDVPLDLDAVGYFDSINNQYHFSGTAAAVPLMNRNSYGEHPSVIGTNSDITLNRISEIQYSLDQGGTWHTASAPDQQVVEFELVIALSEPLETIWLRAIDSTTGISSEILAGTSTTAALHLSSQRGQAFVDIDGDGIRGLDEPALGNTQITLTPADGSQWFGGSVDASDYNGALPDLDGVSLTVEGPSGPFEPELDTRLRSLVSATAGGLPVFHAQELLQGGTVEGPARDRWEKRKFVAHFDQPVGEVRLDVVGLNDPSYGRLEAYDASGNLITRVTKEVGQGDLVTLELFDPAASIMTIRAFGLALSGTGIAISRIDFGFDTQTTTDVSGSWQLPNLPDGEYTVELTPQRLIHQFDLSGFTLQVNQGTSELLVAPAALVDSPRHNTEQSFDVNLDDKVSASDALVIINDLARNSARILGPDETTGFAIDVNNDGSVSALDALQVINQLSREQLGESEAMAADSRLSAAEESIDQVLGQWGGESTDTIGPTDRPQTQNLVDLIASAELTVDSDPEGWSFDRGRNLAAAGTRSVVGVADGDSRRLQGLERFQALSGSALEAEMVSEELDLSQRFNSIQSKIPEPFDGPHV